MLKELTPSQQWLEYIYRDTYAEPTLGEVIHGRLRFIVRKVIYGTFVMVLMVLATLAVIGLSLLTRIICGCVNA